MVVLPHPLCGVHLNLFQVCPVVLGQPLVAYRAVEPLDIGVLLGRAGLDVFELDAPLLGPSLDRGADVLRPVVTTNHAGLTSPGDDLFE